MDLIIQSGTEHKHMLYSIGEHVVIRRLQSEFISRPTYLAHDFAKDLYGVNTGNTILYSYITINDTLTLKDIYEKTPILQFEADECHRYQQAYMTIFNGYIVLIFCVYDQGSSRWDIKYLTYSQKTAPSESIKTHEAASYDNRPHFSILNTGTHLMIDINAEGEDSLWEITSDLELVSHNEINGTLKQQSIWQLDKIESLQDEVDKLKQASSLMMNKISSLLSENEQLKKDNTALKHENSVYDPALKEHEQKLSELSSSLNETKKALTIREAQIESAKKQYNELMDVAQKYRDEAVKWRMALASK